MLSAYITDLLGSHLALVKSIPAADGGTQTGAEVELCGPRTASVRIAFTDEAAMTAMQGTPGSRMLKVYYRPPTTTEAKLVANVVLGRPVLSYSAGVLTASGTDTRARGGKAYVGFHGDLGAVTADSRGVEAVYRRAYLANREANAPIPGPWAYSGIRGTNYDGEAKIAEGQSFSDFVDTISDTAVGPDWDLTPLDRWADEVPPRESGTSAAEYRATRDAVESETGSTFSSALKLYDRKSNDLRDSIRFDYGCGLNNLEDIEVEVGGEQMVNATEVTLSGGDDSTVKKKDSDPTAISRVGIYEGQTSVSVDPKAGDQSAFAEESARSQIAAYADAPIFLTLTLKKDELARFFAFHTFEHGDLVTITADRGFALIPYRGAWVRKVVAQVTGIALAEDEQGRVTQTLTVVVDVSEEEE